MNMASVIVPKSDQINADDLLGQSKTITITDVQIKGGQEQPVSMYFEGSDKAFRPCKSMCRVLVQGWGLDANQYVGRSLTLYCDPTVKFGPLAVGGIRISHMSHLDGPMVMALTATKGVKKVYKVQPLVAPTQAAATEFTIDDARAVINSAETLDDLRVTWSRKTMAPFRDELASLLDERKTALTPATKEDPFGLPPLQEGPSDAHHGEATHTDTGVEIDEEAHPAARAAQLIIDEFADRGSTMAIDNILTKHKADLIAMPEQFRAPVYAAAEARKAELPK